MVQPTGYIVFGFAFVSVFVYVSSNNTIIFVFVLDTSGFHICLAFRWERHIYIGNKFLRPLPMYLTATYIGVTHIRRIPMYPTMICADKDYDGGALGRGLLLMINFPRRNSFPTEKTSAQLIPTTKQYLCTRVMSGITGTSVSSPQQITP